MENTNKSIKISQEICTYPERIDAVLESISKAKENGAKWITNSDSSFLGLAFHTEKPRNTQKYFCTIYNPNLNFQNLRKNPIQGEDYEYVECSIEYHYLEVDTFSDELECFARLKITGKIPTWYKDQPKILEEVNIKEIGTNPIFMKPSLFDFYKIDA